MDRINRIIITAFVVVCVIRASGSTHASSLDQYLTAGQNLPVGLTCDSSGPDILPASYMSSDASNRRTGFTMGELHKYMGYGTIIAAAAAGVSGSDDGFHKGAGNLTAVLAVMTCITGFSEYSYYFDMDEGLSPYNIHIVLATLATVGFVVTAIDANSNDDTGHAGLGIGSGVLMAIPIIVLHF